MFEGALSNQAEADPAREAARAPTFQRPEQSGPSLPLEAHVESSGRGWTIRLPVRAEQITVHKQPVVVEEVAVQVRQVRDVVRLEDTVRREEVRADTEGDVGVTQRSEASRARPEDPTRTRRPAARIQRR